MFRLENIQFGWWAIGLLFCLLLLLLGFRKRKDFLQSLGNDNFLQTIANHISNRDFIIKGLSSLTGLSLLIIAGINPQWGNRRENIKSLSTDVVIAMDLSVSMLCEDLPPSRMERAKKFSQDLTTALKGNRIGLVYFAADAYLQTPLTLDYAAINIGIKSSSPTLVGNQGTDIKNAIEVAERSFDEEKANQRAIILVTDGENHEEDAINLIGELREQGTIVLAVGVGTEEGGPIPLVQYGRKAYKKDDTGNTVISTLNYEFLNKIANEGGGEAYLITDGRRAIDQIKERIDKLEKRELAQKSFSEYNSYYQYFLLPGILLILFGVSYKDS